MRPAISHMPPRGYQYCLYKATSTNPSRSRTLIVSEYDIGYSDDNRQKSIMENQFTMFWNHPKVVGITYLGYIVGRTWRNGTGLMTDAGARWPALRWSFNSGIKERIK